MKKEKHKNELLPAQESVKERNGDPSITTTA